MDWNNPASYLPPRSELTQSDGKQLDASWLQYNNFVTTLYRGLQPRRDEAAPESIEWSYRIRDVRDFALSHGQPYVLYISDEQRYEIAGEGQEAWDEYKQSHGGTSPERTIFESADVQKAFASASLSLFVKLKHTPRIAEKLSVRANTLLIVAPNGEVLEKFGGEDCTPQRVCHYLETDFKNQFTAWSERYKALIDSDSAAPEESQPAEKQ
ncbi:MAG TPA: hypothetical protein VEJ63_00075 [Planctomycetota bacterium]|nr:hypothetical protein [Planctomycetota bacterium]